MNPISPWQQTATFTDADAIPTVTYYYYVAAAGTANGARASDLAGPKAGSRLTPPLATPSNVCATKTLHGYVGVSWDVVPNANYYRVYRSETQAGSKTALGTWQAGASYVDTSAVADVVYYYWVTAAIDSNGTQESGFGGPDTGINKSFKPGAFALDSATYTVNSGVSSVTVTVQRTNGSDGQVTVDLATADGGAKAGVDYISVYQTLTFSDGQASQSIAVTILDNSAAQTSQTFSIALTNPTGGSSLGSPANGTVTIVLGAGTNQPPVVHAGPDQTITLPAVANLAGTATDDGLPNPPGTMTYVWSQVSGPGTVTFGNASALSTTVSFSDAGIYVLQLMASDSALSAVDTVTITVNSAPSVPGTIAAWGNNDSGQLGDGTTTNRPTPVQVLDLSGMVGVAGGISHSLAVKSDGTVWAWGFNNASQLGDGTTTERNTPVQVLGLTGAVAVVGGGYTSLAVKSDRTVWAWGQNDCGQLGDGTTTTRSTPVQVSGLSGVVAVSAAWDHVLAVKSDGAVWAWGYNGYGQLGDGTTTARHAPIQVPGLSGMVAVAGVGYHSLAVKSDGTVWAWGYNNAGQLGDGTTTDRHAPIQVPGLSGVVAVGGGGYHSLAVKSDGTVWAWGDNGNGELGDGTTSNRSTPMQVSGLSGVVAVAGGWYHCLAVKSDGTVWGWGYNYYGQLGDGTTTDRHTPVQVLGLSGAACGGKRRLAWRGGCETEQPTGCRCRPGPDHHTAGCGQLGRERHG